MAHYRTSWKQTFDIKDVKSGVGVAGHDKLAAACNADIDDFSRWMFLDTVK